MNSLFNSGYDNEMWFSHGKYISGQLSHNSDNLRIYRMRCETNFSKLNLTIIILLWKLRPWPSFKCKLSPQEITEYFQGHFVCSNLQYHSLYFNNSVAETIEISVGCSTRAIIILN